MNGVIRDALCGAVDGSDQRTVDESLLLLDGTPDKSNLGANATLGVSLAAAQAAAIEQETPLYRYVGGVNAHVLPVPLMNVLNGGAHADSNVDMQEFMLAPVGAVSFTEALRWGAETYHGLKKLLHAHGLATAVGDEGGFAPNLPSNEDALKLLVEAIAAAGYEPGKDIAIALDPASSEYFKNGRYELEGRGARSRRQRWPTTSPGCATSTRSSRSRTAWPRMTGTAGQRSPSASAPRAARGRRLVRHEHRTPRYGDRRRVANSILVKVNQIGTLTETLDTVALASRATGTPR